MSTHPKKYHKLEKPIHYNLAFMWIHVSKQFVNEKKKKIHSSKAIEMNEAAISSQIFGSRAGGCRPLR